MGRGRQRPNRPVPGDLRHLYRADSPPGAPGAGHHPPGCAVFHAECRQAAVCSFCIAGAALLRTIWGLWFYQSLRPLATYNALFVPIFTMFGLLCLVMSALFRQATEMKAENDLTI